MIAITKGTPVPGNPTHVVVMDSGEYADVDLMLCAPLDNQGTPDAMFQAQFIKYGPVVYQHETPEALGKAIVEIDPSSTHDAAQLFREEEARRLARETGTLAPENAVAAPDAVVEPVEAPTPEPIPEEPIQELVEEEALVGGEIPADETPIDIGSMDDVLPTEYIEPEPVVPVVEVVPESAPAIDISTTTTE